MRIEVVEMLVNGREGACCHRNMTREGALVIPTVEQYRFATDGLFVRYFVGPARAG